MSKSLSYNYSGTKGHIVSVASSLPSSASTLLSQGWEDISDPRGAATGHHTYRETTTGLRIRFDRGTPGANGFAGRNHYHILNPNAHNSRDMYLDSQGNPVPKNSKKSHILT